MMKDKNTMAVVFLQTKQNKQTDKKQTSVFIHEDKPKNQERRTK